jgi:DNA repair exonuclease SbcCD ATPase subunit
MELIEIYGEDIYSFEKFHLDYTNYNQGTTGIIGKNLDMNDPNGAGKSTILRVLVYGLYGKDLEGVPTNEVTRIGVKTGFLVRVVFRDNKDIYTITRWEGYKKDAEFTRVNESKIKGSGLEFLMNGMSLNSDTKTKTQKIIENKLNMSLDVFLNSSLTQQNRKGSFLQANDTDKKDFLSDLLDLNFYDKAFQLIKDDIKELDLKKAKTVTKLEQFKEKKEHLSLQIKESTLKAKAATSDNESKMSQLRTDIPLLQNNIEQIKIKLESIDQEKLILKEKEISTLKNTIKEKEKELSVEKDLNNKKTDYSIKKGKYTEIISQSEERLSNLSEEDVTKLKLDLASKNNDLQESNNNKKIAQDNLDKHTLLKTNINELANEIEALTLKKEKESIFLKKLKEDNKCDSCKREFSSSEQSFLSEALSEKELIITQISETIDIKNNELSGNIETIGAITLPNMDEFQIKSDNLIKLISELENKIIQAENIQKEKESLSQDIIKAKESLNKATTLLAELDLLFNELDTIKKSLRIDRNSLLKTEKEFSSFKGELNLLKENNQLLKEKQSILKQKELELKKLQNTDNAYVSITKDFEKEKDQVVKDIEQLDKSLSKLTEDLKYLEFWKLGFSPTGIRSFITDDVIELLNEKTNEFLSYLSDGSISVEFLPESTSKKGVISNKISTKITIDGKTRNMALNSGGELKRVILAVDLALTAISEIKAGGKFNLRFLDEAFDGISSAGQIKALGLFKNIAKENDGFFIISHDKELEQFCDQIIYVVKQNGISRIVNKTEFLTL